MSSLNAQDDEAAAQRRSAAGSSRQSYDRTHDLDLSPQRHASSAQPSSGQSTDGHRGLPDAGDQQANLPHPTVHPSGQDGPAATGQQPSQPSHGSATVASPGDKLPGPPARLPTPSPLPGPPPWPPPAATPVLQVQHSPRSRTRHAGCPTPGRSQLACSKFVHSAWSHPSTGCYPFASFCTFTE